jgi:hypothetical protein
LGEFGTVHATERKGPKIMKSIFGAVVAVIGVLRSARLVVMPAVALLALVACGPAVPRLPEVPARAGLLNDDANALDAATESRVSQRLSRLRSQSNVEFWVLIVRTTSWLSTSNYALDTIGRWGLDKPPHPPDVVFLLVATEDDEWFVGLSPSLQGTVLQDAGPELAKDTLERHGVDGIEEFVMGTIELLGTREGTSE